MHIIWNGNFTALRFTDEVLSSHVVPFSGATDDSFLLMHDDARPQSARVVGNLLPTETMQRVECPECSPDINLIEYAWNRVGRQIAARPPLAVRDIEIVLFKEWNRNPQMYYRKPHHANGKQVFSSLSC